LELTTNQPAQEITLSTYLITAPVPTELITAVEPYRQKFDSLANVMPPHITIVTPFEYTESPELLHDHIRDVSDTHAPIKVSLAGWDTSKQEEYQLRLPLITGRSEFTELHNELLTGPLSQAVQADIDYWPHVTFGRFSEEAELEQARKSLTEFEPRFIFRVATLELWQQSSAAADWNLQRGFGLNATVLSPPRSK
jgi:2'-5' RNA ligase